MSSGNSSGGNKDDLDLDDPLGIYCLIMNFATLWISSSYWLLLVLLTINSIFLTALQRNQLKRNEYEHGVGGVGGAYGAFSNVLVIGGFAAFALVVQYVFRTIADTE